MPLVRNSKIVEYRDLIRKSTRLNELLFDNRKGLAEIYEHAKGDVSSTKKKKKRKFKIKDSI